MRLTAALALTAALGLAAPAAGADWNHVEGTPGDDRVIGTSARDWVKAEGGAGSDSLYGGTGADHLGDRVWAGGGDDKVYYSRDGRKDVVRCGPGQDTVLATSAEGAPLEDSDFDEQDVFVGCEWFRLSI